VANPTQAGGLVANGDYEMSDNCFWDINATGQTTSFEGTGKSTQVNPTPQ